MNDHAGTRLDVLTTERLDERIATDFTAVTGRTMLEAAPFCSVTTPITSPL